MIFETHAHYDDEQFDIDRDELLQSFKDNNIEACVNVGASVDSCRKTLEIAEKYDFVYAALGVHPNEVANMNDEFMDWLSWELTNNKKVVALGEIGLDYYWNEPEPEVQKIWFSRQIELARQVNKPLIIHSREAAKDTYDIMKSHRCDEIGGVVHCFSYPYEEAKKYLDMGFFLGIGGVVTFKNAKKLVEVVEKAPLDLIVLETDSPYLSPEPNRGKRNSSINIKYVAEKIATIKNISYEEVLSVTNKNAKTLYRL